MPQMEAREPRLTVLAAELTGDERLRERLGPDEALRAAERCMKRIHRAIEGFRGTLVKTGSAELVALFGSAEEACLAAVEMQQRVHGLPPVCGIKLALRACFVEAPAGSDPEAVARRLLALAHGDQILTAAGTAGALPKGLRESARRPQHFAPGGAAAADTIVEIGWNGNDGGAVPAPAPAPAAAPPVAEAPASGGKLCVRYHGRSYLLDEQTPLLIFGRDPASDVVIDDRKASRHHARIERRGERFFYVDLSTNGSYVASVGEPELLLHREETVLRGSGTIGFGMSVHDLPAEQARFEHL